MSNMKTSNLSLRSLTFVCFLFLFIFAIHAQETKKSPVKQTSANKLETTYKGNSTPQTSDKNRKSKTSAPARKAPKQQAKGKKQAQASQKRNIQAKANKKQAAPKKKPEAPEKKKPGTSAHYIALKTNVPMLAIDVKNISFEIQTSKKVSLELPVMLNFSDQSNEHALRTIAFQPECRRWFRSPGKGHYLGAHVHVAWFNMKWDDRRYQSVDRPLLGAGLSYGYKMNFGSHWGAEFNIGAGYANMRYDTFYNIDKGARLNTRQRHYWGITRLGALLVYRF